MKYVYKILKYIGVGLLFVFGVLAIQKALKNPKRLEKKKAEAKKKILDKINKSDSKRKKARDKYSHVIRIFLIMLLTANIIHAKYIVFDTEDQVYRDYGNITNYVKSLEEEKRIFLETQSNTITIYTNSINEIAADCQPTIWERVDFYIGLVVPTILLIALIL